MIAANPSSDPFHTSPGRFPIDRARPLEIVAHNRNGTITIRGVERDDILVRASTADGDDDVEGLRIDYNDNRLEVRTDHRGHGRGADREARRAAREASRAAREASRAASRATQDIFRRREGQFGKGGILGSWQIDFDDHIKHELRDIFPFGRGGSVEILIEIPSTGVEARVEAHATSGEIEVDDIHGAVDAATASGEIALRRVSGDLTVQTASGEITVREPTGTLRARSASGDLEVQHGSLEQFVLNTASGDIHLVTTLIGTGPYRIDAVSGDVDLTLDAPGHILDHGCAIPFKTVSGDLEVSGGAVKVNRRAWHFGPETDKGIEIAIRTVSGDASVSLSRQPERAGEPRAAGPDDATRPFPPARPAAHAQSADPVPPIPPLPPVPPVPPLSAVPPPPTAPVPPTPVLAGADQDSALVESTASTGQQATPSVAAGPEPKGDALSRLADEMAASNAGKEIAAGSVPRAPAAPGGDAAAQPDDRLAVLAALERGEIDIDEAMRRLDSVSPDT